MHRAFFTSVDLTMQEVNGKVPEHRNIELDETQISKTSSHGLTFFGAARPLVRVGHGGDPGVLVLII